MASYEKRKETMSREHRAQQSSQQHVGNRESLDTIQELRDELPEEDTVELDSEPSHSTKLIWRPQADGVEEINAKMVEASLNVFDVNKPLRCPYDKSHIITEKILGKHFEKCRSNFVYRLRMKGLFAPKLVCKYNRDHCVIAPEILYHEARCEDRYKLPLYLLPGSPKSISQRLSSMPPEKYFKIVKENQEKEFNTVLTTMKIGYLQCLRNWGRPIPIKDIRYPVQARIRKEKEKKEKARVAAEVKRLAKLKPPSPPPVAKASTSKQDEDEEDWSNECSAPPTDYFKNLRNPKRPFLIYPPGLTKSQKREFVKWNTEFVRRYEYVKAKGEAAAKREAASAEDSEDD